LNASLVVVTKNWHPVFAIADQERMEQIISVAGVPIAVLRRRIEKNRSA
jgi:hypothetical protein